MKKCCEFAFAAGLAFLLAACGAQSQAAAEPESTPVPVQEPAPVQVPAQTETTYDSDNLASMLSAMTAETENAAQKAADDLADVQAQWGESYEMYMAHTEAADTFYSQTIEEAQALYARLEAIELDYFRCVSAQGLEDYDTWDDAMEAFYDTWNDAMEDYYDAWNDAYEDIYDLSDDLIGEAADELSYEEYSASGRKCMTVILRHGRTCTKRILTHGARLTKTIPTFGADSTTKRQMWKRSCVKPR